MNDTYHRHALGLLDRVNRSVLMAWKKLSGLRLPLSAREPDYHGALADLRSAQTELVELIRVVEEELKSRAS